MQNLDVLVKLAGIGTAGVCVLAIFLIGTTILKLPKDSPPWKAKLMQRFMVVCVIIAVISALSGGANAYFNREKIRMAESDRIEWQSRYETEKQLWEGQTDTFEATVDSLRREIAGNP
jgi:hypothetical protein